MPRGEAQHAHVLTTADVLAIRRRPGEKLAVLAAEFGVSTVSIHNVLKRHTWKHVPEEPAG